MKVLRRSRLLTRADMERQDARMNDPDLRVRAQGATATEIPAKPKKVEAATLLRKAYGSQPVPRERRTVSTQELLRKAGIR